MGLISYLSSSLSTLAAFVFSNGNQTVQKSSAEQRTERTFAEYMKKQEEEAISKTRRISKVLLGLAVEDCYHYALAELGYKAMLDPYFRNDEKRWNYFFDETIGIEMERSILEVADCANAIVVYHLLNIGKPREKITPCPEPIAFEEIIEDGTDHIGELICKAPERTRYYALMRKHYAEVVDKIRDKIGDQTIEIPVEIKQFISGKLLDLLSKTAEKNVSIKIYQKS